MAVSPQKIHLAGLARKLVLEGVLEEAAAQDAVVSANENKIPLIQHLVENGLVEAKRVAHAVAEEFGAAQVDLDAIEIDPETAKLVKPELVDKHQALPIFKRGNKLFLAVADPTNLQGLDEIRFHCELNVEAVVVEQDKLTKTIDKVREDSERTGMEDLDTDIDDFDVDDVDEKPDEDADADIDDAPIVKFVNALLVDAIKKGASDLHFEPYEKYYRVRFRVDGVLQEITRPKLAFAQKIASRIKVMSRMDVAERRVPQDGRIKLKLSKTKAIDFRVNTCPTLFGEKACLRILDSDAAKLQIDQLGYEDFQKELFLENLHKPYGMFLVTGPTGSGKTVSLYTGINILNTVDTNISTAEDPVEINLPGVNQVQVDEKTGMTFPKALKAFLRQDPDIILVGEIRDLDTGNIAVKAAQTGHMVMSTLHTNDGPQTLTRLQDMGIKAFAVATSINIITAQRLGRRLHKEYKQPVDLPPQALLDEGFTQEDIDEGFTVFQATPGPDCESGYKGRVGIYQVMPISEPMKRLIIEGANAVQLSDQADADGVWSIRKSALEKVKQGVTDIAELNRVTVE